MVVGRKPAVSAEAKLNAVLYACQQMTTSIFAGVAVRGKKDQLWAIAAQILDGKVSSSTLALDFASNIHNLREDFTRMYKVVDEVPEDLQNSQDVSWAPQSSQSPKLQPENLKEEEDLESDLEFQDLQAEAIPISASRESGKIKEDIIEKFNIIIDSKSWELIRPYKKDRRDGTGSYWSLKSDYRCILLISIWQQTKVPCCFSIRRYYLRKDNDRKNFLEIHGYCSKKECGATFEATINEEILEEDGSIIFKLSIVNRKEIEHNDAQQFTRELRSNYKKILMHKSAAQVDDIMTLGLSCFYFKKLGCI